MENSPVKGQKLMIKVQGEEFRPLSGKPYFDVILANSHVKPLYHLAFPEKLHFDLPAGVVPVLVTYSGKNWDMTFSGRNPTQKKITSGWRKFVDDNNLKEGDACVFEVMGCRNELLKLRVQILRGDLPPDFCGLDDNGTADDPIIIE